MKVAVIGAGVAGLATLRNLHDKPDITDIVCFEQASEIGGLWLYTDNFGKDENGRPVHSSLYKDLRTNFPKQFQSFPGFKYPSELPDGHFLKAEDVLHYLQGYADCYSLRKYIQFNHIVESVDPIEGKTGQVQWRVETRDPTNQKSVLAQADMFDAVFVCNGKDTVPFIPEIHGLSTFKGIVTHSHDFRTPVMFSGKSVVCIGAHSSGVEISNIIVKVAKKVYLCGKEGGWKPNIPGVEFLIDVKSIGNDFVEMENGRILKNIDIILLCTGYCYSYPFLSPKCHPELKEGGSRLYPLYKHIIHADWPTLYFVGVSKNTIVFRLFYLQAEFAVAALLGKVKCVSNKGDMIKDIEEDFAMRKNVSLPPHDMVPANILEEYTNSLVSLAEPGYVNHIPPVFFRVFANILPLAFKDLLAYFAGTYPLGEDV